MPFFFGGEDGGGIASQSKFSIHINALKESAGSASRTRTYDRAINSRLLYQLSYRGTAKPSLANPLSLSNLESHPAEKKLAEHKMFRRGIG